MKNLLITALTAIVVNSAAFSQTIIFSDNFEKGRFDSTSTGYWQAQPGANGGVARVASTIQGVGAGHQSLYGAAMGKENDGNTTLNHLDLHLNLSGYTQVEFSFWIRDHFDDSDPDDSMWFSDDGGANFTKIQEFNPSEWDDEWGQFPTFDLDRLAAKFSLRLTSQFVIRFQQSGVTDFSGDYSYSKDGIFLDDVMVISRPITYAALPFEEGFATATLGNSWTWSDPTFANVTTEPGTVRPEGFATITGNIQGVGAARRGLFGAALGRRSDGRNTTNALDLHVNLSGQAQVELKFWIKDRSDDTDAYDGIFFSPDAGENFIKIYSTDPSNLPDDQYQQVILDLKRILIDSLGVSFTAQSVIRFQQYGATDFLGDYTYHKDGVCLDDISVIGNTTSVERNDDEAKAPSAFSLFQNHPNPFNPSTQIFFALPTAQKVTLKVFDLTGKEVVTLLRNEHRAAGVHAITFEAQKLPSGIYLYRLQAGDPSAGSGRGFVETKRMVLIR
ncbi:T9SS type A sorting domain-containing protein [candidate division KSB1 bacterium]|nr:T9SS type A sorting domain-containing protein [candidate division KSB1 bacterium]